MYEGIGLLVKLLGCQGKRTEDFSRPADLGEMFKGRATFFKPETYPHEKAYLCLVIHSHSDKLIQYFIT